MRQQLITDLIAAVQEGKKIMAIKAVRAMLTDGAESYREGERVSVEMQRALALVRAVWVPMKERPAYIMGMFDPSTFERDNGEAKEKPQEDDRSASQGD